VKHYTLEQRLELMDRARSEGTLVLHSKVKGSKPQHLRVGISGSNAQFPQVWSPDQAGINVEYAWETVEHILGTSKKFVIS
jgi:hypothetical protein